MQSVEVTSVPGRRVAWKLRPKIIVDISVALINNALPGIDIFYQHDFSHSNMQRALSAIVIFDLHTKDVHVRALGIMITNQRAKSNDEALALPHTILQKILISCARALSRHKGHAGTVERNISNSRMYLS